MKKFIKTNYIELFLCIIASYGLSTNIFGAFFVYEAFRTSIVLTIVTTSVLLTLMYISTYSKKSIAIGFVGLVIGVGIFILLLQKTALNQEKVSYFITIFVCTFVNFLLSRKKESILLLFAITSIAVAVNAFFDYKVYTFALIINIIAIIALYIFKNYKYNTSNTHTIKTSFLTSAIISSLMSIIAMLFACLVFFIVIAPKSLPTQELKLLTELRKFDALQKAGVSGTLIMDNEDKESNKTNDEKRISNEPDEQKDDSIDKDKKDEQSSEKNDEKKKDDPANNSTQTQKLSGVAYIKQLPSPWLLLLFVPLILLLAICIKTHSRKLYLQKIKTKDTREQVYILYTYLSKKLAIIGFKRPKDATPNEYANMVQLKLMHFKSADCTYSDFASIFTNIFYSDSIPTEEELEKYYSFYNAFFDNIKFAIGKRKYFLRFFRL